MENAYLAFRNAVVDEQGQSFLGQRPYQLRSHLLHDTLLRTSLSPWKKKNGDTVRQSERVSRGMLASYLRPRFLHTSGDAYYDNPSPSPEYRLILSLREHPFTDAALSRSVKRRGRLIRARVDGANSVPDVTARLILPRYVANVRGKDPLSPPDNVYSIVDARLSGRRVTNSPRFRGNY